MINRCVRQTVTASRGLPRSSDRPLQHAVSIGAIACSVNRSTQPLSDAGRLPLSLMHGPWFAKAPISLCSDSWRVKLMQIFADGLTGQRVPVDTERFELTEQLKLKLQVFVAKRCTPPCFNASSPAPAISAGSLPPPGLAHIFVYAAQGVTGVPAAHLRVSHAGRQLSDGRQLADYNISQDAVVHLTLRLWCDPSGTCRAHRPSTLSQAP